MNTMPSTDLSSMRSSRTESGLTARTLRRENRVFRGTGGVSAENRSQGFVPAFLDTRTGCVYRACFADGRPAPMHLLEGLPPTLVLTRDVNGRVTTIQPSVMAGFLRDDQFYTREQAAALVVH